MNPRHQALIEKLQNTLVKHCKVQPSDSLLIGVSGGPDSVALFHLLRMIASNLKLHLHGAHLNHALRGMESDEDQRFVETLMKEFKVPLTTTHEDVQALAAQNQWSIEVAARHARHRFFMETARQLKISKILTAHTLDDQAETLLFRLLRGSGATGLKAMQYISQRNEFQLLKPLLGNRKDDLLEFLRENRLAYRIDSSNQSRDYTRNRIRHDLLPICRTIHPDPEIQIAKAAGILAREDDFLETEAARHFQEACSATHKTLEICYLQKLHPALQRRVLIHWLRFHELDSAITYRVVEDLAELVMSPSSKATSIPASNRSLIAEIEGNVLVLREIHTSETSSFFRTELPIPGEIVLSPSNLRVTASVREIPPEELSSLLTMIRIAGKNVCPVIEYFDADKVIGNQLEIRSWLEGDRYQPIGSSHQVKLQDLFTNAKIPRERRSEIPVFISGNEIAWIWGFRISEKFKISVKTTKFLELKVWRTQGF